MSNEEIGSENEQDLSGKENTPLMGKDSVVSNSEEINNTTEMNNAKSKPEDESEQDISKVSQGDSAPESILDKSDKDSSSSHPEEKPSEPSEKSVEASVPTQSNESTETITGNVDNTQDDETEDDSDSEEDDDSDDNDENADSAPLAELENMDKDALIMEAQNAKTLMTPREAIKRLRDIRPLLNEILSNERRVALEKFMEEGNEPDNFQFEDSPHREQFKAIWIQAKEDRKEERERIEQEKVKNLKKKEEILEKLSTITESDETEKSMSEVKELQQEWKKIRVVPADKLNELWERYHFYLDKFYDNHSINIELKELDRKKNLETKIDLCKKVDLLSQENSLKKSFILLNKYQDEFRNTGPVPREYNKEIWERFQQACDKIYEQKKLVFEVLETERKRNFELKEVLVEKASLIAATPINKTKEWSNKTAELDELMKEWKKIGPVPKNVSDSIWKSFRSHFNTFYGNKSQYFKDLHKERKANLILKEDICKRAEELKESDDFSFTTNELIRLQKEWKEIGPVPDKVSNAIWKRFRAACDHFFARKNEQFASKREEENENLVKKEGLITRLNNILNEEKVDNLLDLLKEIQKEWRTIGFVPIKKKKEIENRYQKISDKVFTKFKLDRQSLKEGQIKEHYKHLAELPSGNQRLGGEEIKIKKKIGFLISEIQTLENNMEFFGRSSGAQKLKKEIEDKIKKTKDQIDRMKKELKTIKNVRSSNSDENQDKTASDAKNPVQETESSNSAKT